MLNSGYKMLNACLHTNCNQWVDSDQACKDTAFADISHLQIFHIDIVRTKLVRIQHLQILHIDLVVLLIEGHVYSMQSSGC